MDTEYELYQEAEREIKVPLLAEVLTKHSGDPEGTADPRALADDLFADLDKFFVSLGNSRKSRAGGSFERHLAFLLKRLGLPFEEKQVINGEPDFLLPNADLYLSNPADVILMTAKRTLRERWRQVIIEGIKTPQYFLATIDERLSSNAIREMAQNRIVLVIPQPIIDRVEKYQAEPNVTSFVGFLDNYLEPTRARWR